MKLDEIAPIPPIGTIKTAIAANPKPAPTTGNVAANAAPQTGASVSSIGSTAPIKPVSQQGVDALAQIIKNAGLSQTQISQLMSKAK